MCSTKDKTCNMNVHSLTLKRYTMHLADERVIEAARSHKDRKIQESQNPDKLCVSRLMILLWKCQCKFILNFMFI